MTSSHTPARSRVVRVATEQFARHGTQTSMRDLAATLGMAAPSMYSHFPSKEVLIRACAQDYLFAVGQLTAIERSPHELLDAYCAIVATYPLAATIVHRDLAMQDVDWVRRCHGSLIDALTRHGIGVAVAGAMLDYVRSPWMRYGSLVGPADRERLRTGFLALVGVYEREQARRPVGL